MEKIEVSRGVAQGDPLTPYFFSLAIRKALSEVNAHVERVLGQKVLLTAYLDDV